MNSVTRLALIAALLIAGCGGAVETPTQIEKGEPGKSYPINFHAQFSKTSNQAEATITVGPHQGTLRMLDFNAPTARYTVSDYDGTLTHKEDRLIWTPPTTGGALTYTYLIDHKRGDAHDAKHTATWTILRLGDLFPSARVRTLKGAQSISSITLAGPDDWSFESRYGTLGMTAKFLPTGERNLTRPTGWLIGGKIGTRRDLISGHQVTVSAPVNSGVRRMDTLTFIAWTLPELARVFPDLPEKIFLVGAPKDMWRGGLSAPDSLYLHTDRPLVSENGTSTVLHELVHMSGVHSAAPGADWIVEGLAEYYALLVLLRSNGVTTKRFENTLLTLTEWVEKDGGELSDPSKGVDTAAAVLVLHKLADELEQAGSNIDELVARLLNAPEISEQNLEAIAQELIGRTSSP